MKRSLFLGLILISAAMLSIPFAAGRVNGAKEDIVITQEVLSGDPQAAAGVALRIPSQWDSRLLWETEYAIGGEGAESEFSFLPRKARWEEATEIAIGIYFEMGLLNITDGSPAVSVKDYYDYYPVFMWLEGDSVWYQGDYGEVLEYLTEYFHISVEEGDQWDIRGNKAGISVGYPGIAGGKGLSAVSVSAPGKGGLYFSYDLRDAESGESVDRGQNKGIFFFPYAAGQIDLKQVQKLCPLPEGLCPLELLADQEEGLLYLAARDSGGYSLLVYRTEEEGLRLLQAVRMKPGTEGLSAEKEVHMSFCEGGVLVSWSDNSFCFVVRGEEGYEPWCQGTFPDPREETAYGSAPFPEEHVCAFDGERLVLASYESRGSLNAVVAVYGREGQRYGGLYRHSSEGDWDGGSASLVGITPQGNREQMLELILK